MPMKSFNANNTLLKIATTYDVDYILLNVNYITHPWHLTGAIEIEIYMIENLAHILSL